MALINIFVAIMGLAFGYQGIVTLNEASTSIHEVYGGVLLGTGGIILAIAALIQAVAFPDKR